MDGIELLRKYRDKEIDYNTKIRSLSCTGTEYVLHIGSGADKILYADDSPVSTGYLTNKDNKFEIIEEDKDIEELDTNTENTLFKMECYIGIPEQAEDWNFTILKSKVNELVEEVNKLKKEVNHE